MTRAYCERIDGMAPHGTIWQYEDARGVTHRGRMVTFYDHGGTDVTHAYQSACGAYVMVSGARLRAARTLPVDAEARCGHK